MKQPRQNITLKVAAGYALLGCLFVLSAISVFRYTEALSRVSEAEERLAERRLAAEKVVFSLVRMGNLEQAVTLGAKSRDKAYFESVDSTLAAIARFKSIPRGAVQKARLDTISTLVVMKRDNTLQLLEMMQGDDAARIYKEHIASLRSGEDSAVVKQGVDRPVVSHERTVVVEHSKKGFFNRLADAFRPSKRDTTMVSERTDVIKGDSVKSNLNISDVVASKLGKMASETSTAGRKREAQLDVRRERLLAAGLEMTARLQSILKDVNDYERAAFNRTIAKEIQKRKRAAVWTGCIAAIAVMLCGGSLFMVWHDVSRARRYRDQLEEAKQRAEELLRLRERLMLTVAHDIKSPAASISGFVEMSRKASAEDAREYLDNIGKASSHLLNLVTSLLDYNRLENGRMELSPVDFDLAGTMTDITESFRPQALAKGLSLVYEKDSENGGKAGKQGFHADIFRIRQIIENLLSNALKFTAQGCITLKAAVADGVLTVSVSDTGPGMTEYDQERIFSAFTRLSSAQGIEGVGLGLSISKELVTLLGGTISVESEKGKGSTFSFSIPVEAATKETEADINGKESGNNMRDNSKYATDNPALHGKKLRILLIDDDRMQRQLTHAMLLRLGYGDWDVAACGRVDELFTYLTGNRFDLLLTDIEMPAMSGFEIMKHVRALSNENRTIPVVALTAHVLLDRNDFLKAGFADCLQKPFSMEQLSLTIEKIWHKKDRTIAEAGTDKPNPAEAENSVSGESKEKSQEGDKASSTRLNFSALTAFADGDKEAEMDILNQFKEDTLNHRQSFAQAVEKRDKAEACRLAHKMLPTFTLICSPAVEALRTMENRRGQDGWTDDDSRQCSEIINGIDSVLIRVG